jgi:hypothetical protein
LAYPRYFVCSVCEDNGLVNGLFQIASCADHRNAGGASSGITRTVLVNHLDLSPAAARAINLHQTDRVQMSR